MRKKKMTTTTIMIQLQPFYSAIKRLQPISTIEIFIGFLHLVEIQRITREELKGKSGVYGFLSKTNNKLYIGSSINLNVRFSNHVKGTKSNVLLQNAINKYKLQDFIFIIFEYCEPDKLISREQFYIDELKPEYNILKVAGSSLGYRHTDESLTKMSGENNPMFGKTGENHPMFGKTFSHSAEAKQKISEAMSGENHPMFGRTRSSETKQKISFAKKGIAKSEEHKAKISATKGTAIFVYDVNGTLINTFSSARQAKK